MLAIACGSAAPTTPPRAAPFVPAAADPCAGDAPWLVAILGELPRKSDYIRPERALRDPLIGPMIARGEGRGVDGNSHWLENVSWSSQEIYEYEGASRQRVIVARDVQGKDPRTLGDFGQPPALGAPHPLPSGVVEWPAAAATATDGHHLFTFADRTWVIVEAWMAPRFRAVFSGAGTSPPLPANPPDTYVEYCFPRLRSGDLDGQKEGVDARGADRFAMRFRGGQIASPEIALTYGTPADAQRAEAQERARCAERPCKVRASRVEGRVVRYVLATGR